MASHNLLVWMSAGRARAFVLKLVLGAACTSRAAGQAYMVLTSWLPAAVIRSNGMLGLGLVGSITTLLTLDRIGLFSGCYEQRMQESMD